MLYLDDVMDRSDLHQALDDLVPDLKQTFRLPKVYQLGLAVADAEVAALKLEQQGVPPFFIAEGSPATWIERGQHRTYRGKMGVSHYRGVELELLEPGRGSNVFKRSLDPGGRIVIHHLAYLVKNTQSWAEQFTAAGFDIQLQGTNKIGPARSEFIYMDTREEVDVVIEFFARTCCGMHWWPPGMVYKLLAPIQKWTGKRCLSVS